MRLGGFFGNDYEVTLEEWEPEDGTNIIDPRNWSDQDSYSANRPVNAQVLLPEGAAPFEWFKSYCWFKDIKVYEKTDMSKPENVWKTIYTGLFMPFTTALYNFGLSHEVIYRVKSCHFVIYNRQGKIINEEDREVSREKISEGNETLADLWVKAGNPAAPEFAGKLHNIKPRDDTKSENKTNAGIVSSNTTDDSMIMPKDNIINQTFEILMFGADITPDDGVENYYFIPNTKVGAGWFNDIAVRINVNSVYSGSELKKYIFGNKVHLDSNKYYKILSVAPAGSPRRFIGPKSDISKIKLDSSMVKVRFDVINNDNNGDQ